MINKAVVIGRLTKEPELNTTTSGKSVSNFTVAVEDGYGENKTTDFIKCVAWNKTAEFIANYFRKGQMIAVAGRLKYRTYQGTKGRCETLELRADEVSFCGDKGKENHYESVAGSDFEEICVDEDPFGEEL